MKTREHETGVLFTILLFLSFTMCALFVVLIGGQVYENIMARADGNFSGNVPFSYIANKVRQSDRYDAVTVDTRAGVAALVLAQDVEGERYETLIYAMDGQLWELFARPEDNIPLTDGMKVLDGTLSFEIEDGLLTISNENGASLSLCVRAGRAAI